MENNEEWVVEEIQCDLCATKCITVHVLGTPKLECPECGNMSRYEVTKTQDVLESEDNKYELNNLLEELGLTYFVDEKEKTIKIEKK